MEQSLSPVGAGAITSPGLAGAGSPCVLSPTPGSTATFVVAIEWLDSGAPVISVTGELDLATAPALQESLLALCDAPVGPVIVDLTRCDFIDLRGLRVLLAAQERLERSKQSLALVVGNPGVLRIFQVTRVDGLFEIYPSLSTAAEGNGGDG